MTAPQLLAWLLAMPPVPDGTKQHTPIPRREDISTAIATVCADTTVPQLCAVSLDTIVYRESGGHRFTMGRDGTMHETAGDCPGMLAGDRDCTRERGARSCGPFQTPCATTPRGATALEQTRIAWHWLERSVQICPDHPLWAYATGKCVYTWTADVYERIAKVNAATPLP